MDSVFTNHYYGRAIEIIRQYRRCSPAWLRDQLGLKGAANEFELVWDRLWQAGIVYKAGREYVVGDLPPPPRPSPTVRDVVNAEFARKTEREIAAVSQAMGRARLHNRAAEKRRAALAAAIMKNLGGLNDEY